MNLEPYLLARDRIPGYFTKHVGILIWIQFTHVRMRVLICNGYLKFDTREMILTNPVLD